VEAYAVRMKQGWGNKGWSGLFRLALAGANVERLTLENYSKSIFLLKPEIMLPNQGKKSIFLLNINVKAKSLDATIDA
jgi:hypothetical protein